MFKLGNRVHCSFNDKDGTITKIDNPESETYPLVVTFDDETTDQYNSEGSWTNGDDGIVDLTIIS